MTEQSAKDSRIEEIEKQIWALVSVRKSIQNTIDELRDELVEITKAE